MKKKPVAIIGSGNIGMDLLYKIKKSPLLEVVLFIGRDKNSVNIERAKKMGYRVSTDSINAITADPYCCDIVFDATTADAHKCAAPVLKKLGKFVIDLTPSKVGMFCVPCLNANECIMADNVNMVTCGGQSLVPMAVAIKKVCPQATYMESVSTIASKSAGAGTRANIDEYVQTTAQAIKEFSGVDAAKSMIVLNPAEPPIIMRNTLYVVAESPDMAKIKTATAAMEQEIMKYVPGFKVIVEPTLYEKNIVAVTVQVKGSGDFLPAYAGNLDIITCAAIEIAEKHASEIMNREEACPF